MSIRTDGTGEYLRRTASLPDDASFTACGWHYISTARTGQWRYICALEDAAASSSHAILLGFSNADNLQLAWTTGAGSFTGSNFASNPSTGVWFFWAVVSSGTGAGSTIGYWGTGPTLNSVASSSARSAFTPAALYFNNDSYDEWMDSRMAALKVWDTALAQAELEREMYSYLPVRWSNLHAYWPGFQHAQLEDWSGNAKSLTAGGTLTTEDGPPIAIFPSWETIGWQGTFTAGGVDTTLAAVLTGTGSLSAALTTQIQMAAALTGTGALAAALTTQIQLATQLSASASLVADLLTEIRLAAALQGTGAVVGDLQTDIRLAAALSGIGSVAAALTTQIRLASVLSGTGTLTADLQAGAGTLAAVLQGTGSVAAALTTDIRLAAALSASATLAAALTTQIRLAAALTGTGSVTADLTTAIRLAAALSGSGTLAAALTTEIRLATQLLGSGALAGDLQTQIRLAALLNGTGSLTADLAFQLQQLRELVGRLHVLREPSGDLSVEPIQSADLHVKLKIDSHG